MKPRLLLAAVPGAACMLSLAACGPAASITGSGPPASAAPAPRPPQSAPAPSASQADSTVGRLGDTGTFTDSASGWSYSATLVKILDPAQPDSSFDAADSGKRLVGAEFRLTGISGRAQDDADSDATVKGTDSQLYAPVFSGLSAGTNFSNGSFSLRPGSTEIGWVTFELPDGVKVAEVQWDAGGGSPVTWVISGT